ncbi:YfhO family protein [Pedobacter gandavensis]|uniref:YfhO family protein n=1 Tax=Pedobacter gandavensis TaxID=2679963 RepID=A0ABR6EUF7_9SPHI|nr:YfhO family protein [Pedobacter gandavensis]MBB2148908.1 YfhO family protein [Pedobacter gandavensis]
MNNWFKRNGQHLMVIVLFFGITFLYFNPVFFGKTLGQNDVTRAQSTTTEINHYREKGETILWTNQIHGGMPTFQIWAPYPNNITTWLVKAINYSFPQPVGTVLVLLLGSYFLFCVLKLNPWLSATGAIAFTFSSYNIILFGAGHANQVAAISFFAPVIAGILLVFRGKYIYGAAITALFLALEIRANHIQMTYYLFLAILILVGIEAYHAVKSKQTKDFFKAAGFAFLAGLLAIAVNTSSLWSTYEYSAETIRGHANLTQNVAKTSTGLSREYAYQWSQGVEECITFLIPNAFGGSSRGNAVTHTNAVKALTEIGADESQADYLSKSLMPFYWGEKPFTEGSFYFGAVICFLFVLGLFIVKNRIKWWLLSVVILTMLLSFGKNMPLVSDIFFYYAPFYNKFRAVESILAVAGLCFPILAVLAVNELFLNRNKAELFKQVKLAFYITFGFSLAIAIIPTLFLSFKSSDHEAVVTQFTEALKIDKATGTAIGNAVIADRKAAAQSDAMRSCLFILIAFAGIWAFLKDKLNFNILSLAFLFLILIDMWGVDKRYLNKDTFMAKQDTEKPQFREVDRFIDQDKDPNFKVIDLTQSIMNDATTPYFHKSIGGYSAVRLKRFDEVIETHFKKTINLDILGMMNTKYLITTDPESPKLIAQLNPDVCGHAWFVNKVQYVTNADQEMAAIGTFKPKETVVIDQQYKPLVKEQQTAIAQPSGTIKLTSYFPDRMVYQSNAPQSNIAVFSEIYYNKGWKMFIDQVEQPYFRANYLLRAAHIPAGNHQIEFVFHPASYYTGEIISLIASITLIIGLLLAGYLGYKEWKSA